MEEGRFYLADEKLKYLSDAQEGRILRVGSLVDVEDKSFSKLVQVLQELEKRGVLIESVNEPTLNGKTFSKLQDSIALLKYFSNKM